MSYSPKTNVYDGTAKDIGEARVMLTDPSYTSNGEDPWIFLYAYMGQGKKADGTYGAVSSDTAGFSAVSWRPIDAQTADHCSSTVWVYNRKYSGKVTTAFAIDSKPLTDEFIAEVDLPANGYTYNGGYHRPPFLISDPALNRPLEFNREWAGGYEGTISSLTGRDSAYTDNIDAGSNTAKITVVGLGNYTGSATYSYSIARRPISIDASKSIVKAKTYDGTVDIAPESLTVIFTVAGRPGVASNTGLIVTTGTGAQNDSVPFIRDSAYVVRSATYNSPDVFTTPNGVSATVDLIENGTVSKNYTLTSPTFTKTAAVSQKVATAADLSYTIDTTHYFNGEARGIGDVEWVVPSNAETNSITVLYNISNRDTTQIPVAAGRYTVKARIGASATSNYAVPTTNPIVLGDYVIKAPLKPVITDQTTLKAQEVRSGRDLVLTIAARSPNGGELSYQWYKDNVAIAGESDSFFVFRSEGLAVGSSSTYFVQVTNTVEGVQVPDSVKSNSATVRVIDPAIDISGAVITAAGAPFTYTGNNVNPRITVTHFNNGRNNTLSAGTDYDLVISDPINAGDALVTVTGKGRYEGEEVGSFVINKKKLERADFTYTTTNTYNTEAQPLRIIPASPKTGIGPEEVLYGDLPAGNVPTDAGSWAVTAKFGEGDNFLGDTAWFTLGTYTIAQKTPAATDFLIDGVEYTTAAASIPTGHVFNGAPQGIGTVTIKGTGSGAVTLKYAGKTDVPSAAGSYAVTVDVAGGTNYRKNTVTLGTYVITSVEAVVAGVKNVVGSTRYGPVRQADVNTAADAKVYVEGIISALELNGVATVVREVAFVAAQAGVPTLPGGVAGKYDFNVLLQRGTVSDSTGTLTVVITATPAVVGIAGGDRVIPGSKDETAVVAPVKVVAGEFAVGPNPVAKASGKVAFFWQGKAVKNGTLYIFDASGSLVKKVAVADKGVDTARRGIGAWDLTGVKGAPVAEGTYLVKGVLVGKDGAKVKVSSLVGVTK